MSDVSWQPGSVVAGFVLERELGAGGMGVVFLARHPRLPRWVALKLLRSDLGQDPVFVRRFQREAETVARLEHPNIVPIEDCGADEGQLWLSMRYINGTTADKALDGYPAGMPPERAVVIVERVAAALDYAHRRNVLHRDVKPANILLTTGTDDDPERVFLTDFGVAKAFGQMEELATSLTSAGGVVATVDYASPEQIEGRPLDGRCDVYALGCVLFKLLTGLVPFAGQTLAAKVFARFHHPVPAPSKMVPGLPVNFDVVIATALAREAADRFATCGALAAGARAALLNGRIAPRDPDTERIDSSDPQPTEPASHRPRDAGAGRGHTLIAGPASLTSAAGAGRSPGEHLAPGRQPQRRRRPLLAVVAVLVVAAVITTVVLITTGRTVNRAAGPTATTSSPSLVSNQSSSPSAAPIPTGISTAQSAAELGGMNALIGAAEQEGELKLVGLPARSNFAELVTAFQTRYPGITVESSEPDATDGQKIQAAPDVLNVAGAVAQADGGLFAP